MRLLAHTEQHQEKRKHRGGRRRAEKVDHELDRAIYPLGGAQHDAERNCDGKRDGERQQGAPHRLQEIPRQASIREPRHKRLRGGLRRRQQDRVDEL
jgi:hypothetical protein